MQRAYYRPHARFDVLAIIMPATAGLDISDGLSQDLGHLCAASGCGASLQSSSIPIAEGATLEDALFGGDDYELLIASDESLPGTYPIGVLTAESGLTLDSAPLAPKGFDHFGEER